MTERPALLPDHPLPRRGGVRAPHARQRARPVTAARALWVIVDDGSNDETPAILAEYAAADDVIHVIRRADRGDRKLGGGVIDAFYEGYDTIDPVSSTTSASSTSTWTCRRGYFEARSSAWRPTRASARAAASRTSTPATARLVTEQCGDENSVGMVKFYRTGCFEQIGGFVRKLMWDGIDCHRCRMLGWMARELGRPGAALRAPAADGHQPQELVDRPGAARRRASTSWAPARCTCSPARWRG